MGKTLTYKILEKNLLSGNLVPGEEIKVKVNQTLTQDSTGTMVYLQLGAMNIDKVKTELSVAYIDHNTLQAGFENADDHEFIKTTAAKHGIVYSKPGSGICHQVHLERFGIPGKLLIGSDSHTPTGGGMGMIAIGAGGLDVAVGMATGAYFLKAPKVLNVELVGELKPWSSAKDVILEVLRQLTVKGGVGYVIEYSGEGVKNLSLTDRATITNMGAELGATTSIFPSDECTKDFLQRQGRGDDFVELFADADAQYDKKITVDLSTVVPLAAAPHSPDNIVTIKESEGKKVDQVGIGSCTNSSFTDMMKAAKILEGKRVHPDVSLVIAPGSSSVLKMLAENGALATMISAGARILESACGPCIGMGQAPKSGAVSLRTFNRNFKGRSGTLDADIYLVSPETAAVSAVTGVITDPRSFGDAPVVEIPSKYANDDSYFIYPPADGKSVEIVMGPNIKPFPIGKPLEKDLTAPVSLVTGDNITTDDIMPSNAKLLPFRSNVPELSKHCFINIDAEFSARSKELGNGIIIGGDNYGQGSSREHAALVPLYLGVRVVIAKSFARIHKANLINSGIIPLEFVDAKDYDKVSLLDNLSIENALEALKTGRVTVKNTTTGQSYETTFTASERDVEIIQLGGYLNYCIK